MSKGVQKVPWGETLIIDILFHRVATDLIGTIAQVPERMSGLGYAMCYPEAAAFGI